MEKNPAMISRDRKKVHCVSNVKHVQDAVYWITLSRAQDHGSRFWQTKSNAIIVQSPVPANCVNMVTPTKGSWKIHERLPALIGKCSSSIRSSSVNTRTTLLNKNPNFKVDLRVEGVPENVIFKDEEQMKQINELKDGSKSVRGDLKNGDMTFTKESSRVIYDTGNVELFELGQISMTVQCHSCLKHVPERV